MGKTINAALVELWDEVIEDERCDMIAVLLTREQQRALHDEMRADCGQAEGYEWREGRWHWRGMPIHSAETAEFGYSRWSGARKPYVGFAMKIVRQ